MNKSLCRGLCVVVIASALFSPVNTCATWSFSGAISALLTSAKKHYIITGLAAIGTVSLLAYYFRKPAKKSSEKITGEKIVVDVQPKLDDAPKQPVLNKKEDADDVENITKKFCNNVSKPKQTMDKSDVTDANWAKYVGYNLFNCQNKLARKKFVLENEFGETIRVLKDKVGLVTQVGGAQAPDLFAFLLARGYFMSANLCLYLEAVDFERKYRSVGDTDNTWGAHSFLAYLRMLCFACSDFTMGSNMRQVKEPMFMEILTSHGATTINGVTEEVSNSFNKYEIKMPSTKPSAQKLYFSADGKKTITEKEFLKQLDTL